MTLKRTQVAAARQLSLVAYLLSVRGKPRNEKEIHTLLPSYTEVYDASMEKNAGDTDRAGDALRKQLERDVEALENVGITVKVEGRSDGRRYSLSAEGFSQVELDLTPDERSVLVGALRSLRRDFPYLGPLKLAVANVIGSASGGGSSEEAASFAAIATRDDERVSSRLGVLEKAILRKKRVKFDYYAINSDKTSKRELEPYALSHLEGIWYVTGWDTNREAVRQFRLSRVKGRMEFASRYDHEFTIPENFERRIIGPRAAWQMEDDVRPAYIRVSHETFRAARIKYGLAISASDHDEVGRILYTRYSGERQLAGWVLSLGEDAKALKPDSLVERIEDGLERIVEAHS